MADTLGLDIGGANLKWATATAAGSVPLPLWKAPDRLLGELSRLIETHRPGRIAVTMTGELCDCFESKAEGVRFILDAVLSAAGERPVLVWQTAGEFVDVATAAEFWMLTAAANWHALATWLARLELAGRVAVVDIGSTTSDLVVTDRGRVACQGLTDRERLASGELCYTGVRRTPLMAVCDAVTIDGRPVATAAEVFATTADVHTLRGDLPADAEDRDTADGRERTPPRCRQRIARMVCADAAELGDNAVDAMAAEYAERQLARLVAAGMRLFRGPIDRVVVAGEGEFLARRLVDGIPAVADAPRTSLRDLLGPDASEAACAAATVRLAEDVPAG